MRPGLAWTGPVRSASTKSWGGRGAGAQLTFSRQTLGVDSFGCQEGEAGIDVLDLDKETQTQLEDA